MGRWAHAAALDAGYELQRAAVDGWRGDGGSQRRSRVGRNTTLVVMTSRTFTVGAAHTLTVTAKDASGNVAIGYRDTIHFTSTDKKAILPDDYTFTAADAGVHKFSLAITLNAVGKQSVRARDTATSTIAGLQTGIVVSLEKVLPRLRRQLQEKCQATELRRSRSRLDAPSCSSGCSNAAARLESRSRPRLGRKVDTALREQRAIGGRLDSAEVRELLRLGVPVARADANDAEPGPGRYRLFEPGEGLVSYRSLPECWDLG